MYREPDIADDIREQMLSWRCDIHAHPETAFEEQRTADIVAQALTLMNIEVVQG
jgi:metal-dependent amidase/aminoacylase/carboxypeptidase family protein